MFPLIIGAALLAMVVAGGASAGSDTTIYTDRNGVRWRIRKEPGGPSASGAPMSDMWSASTDGYGGQNAIGYVSVAGAIENIEGNAERNAELHPS